MSNNDEVKNQAGQIKLIKKLYRESQFEKCITAFNELNDPAWPTPKVSVEDLRAATEETFVRYAKIIKEYDPENSFPSRSVSELLIRRTREEEEINTVEPNLDQLYKKNPGALRLRAQMFNRLEALLAGRTLSATLQDAQGERQYYIKTLKELAHLLIDKNLPREEELDR